MAKILLLNGASSSGKTTLAEAIQEISPEPWIIAGADMMLKMMPPQYLGFGSKASEGFGYTSGTLDNHPFTTLSVGDFGMKMAYGLAHVIQTLYTQGFNIIVDEILLSVRGLNLYKEVLKADTLYFMGVTCQEDILYAREAPRQERAPGVARAQISYVNALTDLYDLFLDTTTASASDLAAQVLDYIKANPNPQGFRKISTQAA